MSEREQSERQKKSWEWKNDNELFNHLMRTLPSITGLMVSRALEKEEDCNVEFLMGIVTGDREIDQIGTERRKHIARSLVKWMQKLEAKPEEKRVGKAYFDVSYTVLENLLKLPSDARITFVRGGKDIGDDIFRVYVEHPDLYIVEEGEKIPRVDPSVTIIFDWGK